MLSGTGRVMVIFCSRLIQTLNPAKSQHTHIYCTLISSGTRLFEYLLSGYEEKETRLGVKLSFGVACCCPGPVGPNGNI